MDKNFPIIITFILLNNQTIPIEIHKNNTETCEICSQLEIPEQC